MNKELEALIPRPHLGRDLEGLRDDSTSYEKKRLDSHIDFVLEKSRHPGLFLWDVFPSGDEAEMYEVEVRGVIIRVGVYGETRYFAQFILDATVRPKDPSYYEINSHQVEKVKELFEQARMGYRSLIREEETP